MKKLLLFSQLLLLLSCSNSKKTSNTASTFEKIVYHSSRCFGSCPQIDLQVSSNREILVHRELFTGKNPAPTGSGNFKGTLSQADYDELMKVLTESDYKNLKFPAVYCCDGVIVTIIVYDKGERTYLKSMTPPPAADKLIALLARIGKEANLAAVDEKIELEN